MRPLQLELVRFRSYDRASVDWRQHDLVVICGDTGAGKTSLLDAISFALYGRTSQQASSGDLLTLGDTKFGEVRFEFSLGDEFWRVTRRYGKDAPAPSALLESLDGDAGPVVETIGGEDAVAAALTTRLRMSFAAFTSAVLLAQGRFDQFLAAKPKDRDDILRELFDVASLDGARQSALARQKACEGEAAVYRAEASRLADTSNGVRNAAARAARAAAADNAAVRALASVVSQIARLDESASREADRAVRARRVFDQLPDEAAQASLTAREAQLDAAVVDAEAELATARAAHQKARDTRDATLRDTGGDAATVATALASARRLAELDADLPARSARLDAETARIATERESLETTLARLAESQKELDHLRRAESAAQAAIAATAAAEAAVAARAPADARVAVAEHELQAAAAHAHAARRQFDDVRKADLAASVRAAMSEGDTCPVCGGTLATHAPHPPNVAVAEVAERVARADEAAAGNRLMSARAAALQRAEAQAEAERVVEVSRSVLAEFGKGDSATLRAGWSARITALESEIGEPGRAATAAREQLANAAGLLAGERQRLTADQADVDQIRSALGPLAKGGDPVATLVALAARLECDERAERAAGDAVHTAATRAGAADREREAFRASEVSQVRSSVARAAAMMGDDPPAAPSVGELVEQVVALRRRAEAVASDAERQTQVARTAQAEATQRLRDQGAVVGINAVSDHPEIARRRGDAVRVARQRLAEIAAAAAQRQRLALEEHAARIRGERYAHVANDLKANMFPRFLLGRYRERLAVGASARLAELSAGAYRFSGSGADPLSVIDMRRGERTRSAATLSGGERFLASLSLALGLSDIAAESGGRLDCLFLDEGFSTLDSDALEQALTGVERLSGDGRLIAVITHLPGVAERLGAMIRVEKDAEGRSRIASSSAGG